MTQRLKHRSLNPQIFNIRIWVESADPLQLKETVDLLLSEARFKVLNFVEYHFPVKGYTALWLLAESHFAIHTFPDHGYSYLELSGCNKDKTDQFHQLLKKVNMNIVEEEVVNMAPVSMLKRETE